MQPAPGSVRQAGNPEVVRLVIARKIFCRGGMTFASVTGSESRSDHFDQNMTGDLAFGAQKGMFCRIPLRSLSLNISGWRGNRNDGIRSLGMICALFCSMASGLMCPEVNAPDGREPKMVDKIR